MQLPTSGATWLSRFNALDHDAAVGELLGVCASKRWADAVAERRPFADGDALQLTARDVWRNLEPADWRASLDGHPRIGESGGSAAEHSRREQAGMASASDLTRMQIADGNRRYEQRFDHVFLIAAAGREPTEILAELDRRLENSADEELREVRTEHEKITRLRLDRLLG